MAGTMNQNPIAAGGTNPYGGSMAVGDLGMGAATALANQRDRQIEEERKRKQNQLTDQAPRDIISPAVQSLFGIGSTNPSGFGLGGGMNG